MLAVGVFGTLKRLGPDQLLVCMTAGAEKIHRRLRPEKP